MNSKIYSYSDMAKQILFHLGEVYEWDGSGYYDSGSQDCSYKGYGLEIRAYDLPNIVFEDRVNGGLSRSIIDYMNKISIRFNHEECFNSEKNICTNGLWESVFLEMYKKLPVLIQQKEYAEQIHKHCNQLLRDVIEPSYKGDKSYDTDITRINENIIVGFYKDRSNRMNSCGAMEDDYYYFVKYNNKVVFHVVGESYDDYNVITYVPGTWESDLKNHLEQIRLEYQRKKYEQGLDYLEQLRRL